MFTQIRLLGSGFFGQVWLEHDTALDRLCAAKYLTGPGSTSSPVNPFNEAQAMLRVQHENVVRVYSAEMEASGPVIRMEYMPAGSVSDQYGTKAAPALTAVKLLEGACRGVEALHTAGLLHRDLKPANLMIGASGDVKVSDFGLACGERDAALAPIGYVPHLPPEVLPNPGYIQDRVGDVWALGMTAYRLLNGDSFLNGGRWPAQADLVDGIKKGSVPPREGFSRYIHPRLSRVIKKALMVDPARRFGTATEFRHALERSRPVVGWSELVSGEEWIGETGDGSRAWRAYMIVHKSSAQFVLEKRGPSGTFRRVSAGCSGRISPAEASSFASNVLQSIAERGSPPN